VLPGGADDAARLLEGAGAGTVVEAFFGLLALPRPTFADEGDAKPFRGGGAVESVKLEPLLLKHSRELHAHITTVFAEDGNLSSHPVSDLFLRPAERLMVGLYAPDVVMFIWDQCMLTSFVDMIPKFAVATLLILKEALLQADTPQMLIRVLSQQARAVVSVKRLQHMMSRKFMKQVREHLGIADANSSLWGSVGGVDGMEESLFSMRPDREFEGLRGMLGDQHFEEQMAKMDLNAAREEMARDRASKKAYLSDKEQKRLDELRRLQARNDKKRATLKMRVRQSSVRHYSFASSHRFGSRTS
jgi:hypothetical protein